MCLRNTIYRFDSCKAPFFYSLAKAGQIASPDFKAVVLSQCDWSVVQDAIKPSCELCPIFLDFRGIGLRDAT